MNNEVKYVDRKILIVEDDRKLLRYIELELQHEGYHTHAVSNGKTGLDEALTGEYVLIVLDIMLPEKDGMAVLEEIQKEDTGKKGPIVLLTNLNSEDLIERAYKLGADDYLIKSEISLEDITKKVKQYLG